MSILCTDILTSLPSCDLTFALRGQNCAKNAKPDTVLGLSNCRPHTVPHPVEAAGIARQTGAGSCRAQNAPAERPVTAARPYSFCGKPRLSPPWLGSSHRVVMTLFRV